VQQVLAQVATEIEAARLLVQRASWMGRAGKPMTGGQGSMSKLKAGDVAMWATRTLMDVVGPYAWSKECPLEKWFRDAKIYQLFEGTAEIQRLVISRMQAEEYRQRLSEGAEIAAAVGGTVAAAAPANGDQAPAEGAPARAARTVASENGAGSEEQSKTTA
jgi:Acyl-CoA dehydrogenase, C-terminal domain